MRRSVFVTALVAAVVAVVASAAVAVGTMHGGQTPVTDFFPAPRVRHRNFPGLS